MNNVTVIGNITTKPEIKDVSGNPCLNFCLAVNDYYKKKDSEEWTQTTAFVNVTFWGDRAAKFAEKAASGSKVLVSGKIKGNQWTDSEGKNRNSIYIEAKECLTL